MAETTQALGLLAFRAKNLHGFEEISIENKPISGESISHNQTPRVEKMAERATWPRSLAAKERKRDPLTHAERMVR